MSLNQDYNTPTVLNVLIERIQNLKNQESLRMQLEQQKPQLNQLEDLLQIDLIK